MLTTEEIHAAQIQGYHQVLDAIERTLIVLIERSENDDQMRSNLVGAQMMIRDVLDRIQEVEKDLMIGADALDEVRDTLQGFLDGPEIPDDLRI